MALCASVGTHLSTCAGSSLSSQFRASKLQWRASRLQWDPLRVAAHRFSQGDNVQVAHPFKRGLLRSMPLVSKATRQRLRVCASHDRKVKIVEENSGLEDRQQRTLLQRAADMAASCFDVVRRPAVVALIVSLVLTQVPESWAASGGMMGGRTFSPGGGRPGGSAGRSFSAPRSSFSFSAPYAAPSPFFGGGFGPSIYVAPAYGFGIGGGSSFLVLLLGFLAFFFISGFLTDRTQTNLFSSTSKTSVLKLQVLYLPLFMRGMILWESGICMFNLTKLCVKWYARDVLLDFKDSASLLALTRDA